MKRFSKPFCINQQDNGIKEVGKRIVSVKENVGFVAFGARWMKHVGICECHLLYSDIINWISNNILIIMGAWGTVKNACISQYRTVRAMENFSKLLMYSLSFSGAREMKDLSPSSQNSLCCYFSLSLFFFLQMFICPC